MSMDVVNECCWMKCFMFDSWQLNVCSIFQVFAVDLRYLALHQKVLITRFYCWPSTSSLRRPPLILPALHRSYFSGYFCQPLVGYPTALVRAKCLMVISGHRTSHWVTWVLWITLPVSWCKSIKNTMFAYPRSSRARSVWPYCDTCRC